MATNPVAEEYEDIDEAEEEALLKSDDEYDAVRAVKATLNVLGPLKASALTDEDSLMNEAEQLGDDGDVEVGISADENDGEGNEDGQDDNADDDDDDDEDSDNDTKFDKITSEYNSILTELESNLYVYDKYLRLCELAHSSDDLDKIRYAYSRFAAIYPLSPELWLKYLSIEVNVALSAKEVEKVEELFRQALLDYYAPDVALEFAALAPRCVEPERIWCEILSTYGLHCIRGQEFFKLYRQYVFNHPTLSDEEKQDAYIQNYLRELKYPLNNMEESYIEFKVFYEKNKTQIHGEIDWAAIDKDYFKAKEHLQRALPFEEKLKAIDAKCYRERAELYIAYIKEMDKFLDENILQTLYERMVADCCLNADCWLRYIDFIDYRDEYGRPEELQELPIFQQDALDVSRRALRNCTWSEKLYIKRMHLLEKREKTREDIQEVLESSFAAGFQTADPAVAVWLEYLTYLRRHTDWENEGECEILRKNFNLAWTILGQQWGVLADCNCEILQFWGRLEYGPLQNPKRGKELWTTAMESADNPTKSGLWIEFAQLEMRRDLEATRRLFRKALHTPGLDNPGVIASAWERFERCNGTIKTVSLCTNECTEFLMKSHANQRTDGTENLKGNKSKGTKRKSTMADVERTPEKKAKMPVEADDHQHKQQQQQTRKTHPNEGVKKEEQHHEIAFKEHENQEIDLSKDHLRVFLSNLDYSLSTDDIRANLPELKIVSVDLVCAANGRSRGFGYMELESEAEVEKALTMDRRILNGRPLYVSSVLRDKEKRQKFKYSDGVEPKKLFIKGLPPDVTKEELEQLFGAFGKLTDVRLVFHKSGKFKNIAYVEFADETAASKAVMATDQMSLRDHKMTVAISAPPPKATSATINPSKLLGISARRNKVFDQKPRMSLIPNVVRKKLLDGAVPSSAPRATNGTSTSTKTNDDFRKLLQK